MTLGIPQAIPLKELCLQIGRMIFGVMLNIGLLCFLGSVLTRYDESNLS